MNRICTYCKKEKDVNEFYKNHRDGGFLARCKQCLSEINSKFHKIRYNKNPQKYIKLTDEWRRKNPEKVKQHQSKGRWKRRIEVLKAYSNGEPKCACCGETEIKFLTIDHLNKLGSKHRKMGLIGTALVCYLKKNNYPKGYQILCYNCNMAKGFWGRCPHRKGRCFMNAIISGKNYETYQR